MNPRPAPKVIDDEADRQFRDYATSIGKDPDSIWFGGYVDYEWNKGRHYFAAFIGNLTNRHILEFGCNVGATAIVLDHMGAKVSAVDIDNRIIRLAGLNAKRYGCDRIDFTQASSGAPLKYADQEFDVIICNSVLEYVEAKGLDGVLAELDRVLKPGGCLLVLGTSNRLFPKEVHSGRWVVNYVPRCLDFIWGSKQRGIFPWQVKGRLRHYTDMVFLDEGAALTAARRTVGETDRRRAQFRLLAKVGRLIGFSAGELLPSFFLALRKPTSFPHK